MAPVSREGGRDAAAFRGCGVTAFTSSAARRNRIESLGSNGPSGYHEAILCPQIGVGFPPELPAGRADFL